MGLLRKNQCHIGFQKEASIRLYPTTLSEDDILPFDLFESIELPEAYKEFAEFWAVNGGRNPTDIIDEGVPVIEPTINFEMQTGICLYYAIGKCTTTPGVVEVFTCLCEADVLSSLNNKYWLFTLVESIGDDVNYYVWYNVAGAGTDPAIAGKTGLEVAIAEDAAAAAVATATALVINALTYATCPAPGAGTITVTAVNMGSVTDAADGNTGWVAGAPNWVVTQAGVDNVHVITEDDDNDPPSLAFYFEQLFSVHPLLKNELGAVTSELTIDIVKDAHVKGAWTVKLSKEVDSEYEGGAALATWAKNTVGDGSDITDWIDFHHKNLFNSSNPKLKVFTFGSTNHSFTLNLDVGDYLGDGSIDASAWNIEKCSIKVSNDVELLPVMGDECFKDPDFGKREYEITLFIFPQDTYNTLRRLRESHPDDYYCNFTVKLSRSTRDYVQVVFSKLWVKSYPNKTPEDAKNLGLEVVFKASPGNTTTTTVKDALGIKFYEVS